MAVAPAALRRLAVLRAAPGAPLARIILALLLGRLGFLGLLLGRLGFLVRLGLSDDREFHRDTRDGGLADEALGRVVEILHSIEAARAESAAAACQYRVLVGQGFLAEKADEIILLGQDLLALVHAWLWFRVHVSLFKFAMRAMRTSHIAKACGYQPPYTQHDTTTGTGK